MTDDGRQIGADLTPREREVLAMVAAGLTNREIGQALFISESTAGVHVSNLMAKLGVGSRTEAAAVAYRAGLIESVNAGVTIADGPQAQAAIGAPASMGWWARFTNSFNAQVEHHPRRVAAAGIGGLAILSLITVGLAMAVFGEEPTAGEQPDPTATARPTASPSPRPSAKPSSSPSPSPTAVPIGGADVNLDVDGLARIVTDNVSLRTSPSTDAPRYGYVPKGSIGFVVAGPVTEDGYAWYQLAALEPYASCGPLQPEGSLGCADWFGWTAAGGTDGEEWLAPVEPDCPASADASVVAQLRPLERLSCFGSTPMTLRLYRADNHYPGGCGGVSTEPSWLGQCEAFSLEIAETLFPKGNGLVVQQDPSLGACVGGIDSPMCVVGALPGRWLKVVAHFDDPRALGCRSVGSYNPDPDPAATVLRCRTALVATKFTVDDGLGFMDHTQLSNVPEFPLGYGPHSLDDFFHAGVAQTFTPRQTGGLTAIQLLLSARQGTNAGFQVQIRDGSPDGELLATSQWSGWPDLPTDAGDCLPPECLALNRSFAWVTIHFDEPVDVTVGHTYAFVLPPGTITASSNPSYYVASQTVDAFAGGVHWWREYDGDTWQSNPDGADLAFRLLVLPDD